jgi:rod shape-determining protein MreD
MRWLRFALLVCITSILQAGFLSNLNLKLDLLMILLVFFAIYYSSSEAIVTSFTLGFAADIFGQVMGPQMISFGIIGTALSYMNRVIAIKKKSYQAIVIFIATILVSAISGLLNTLKDQSPPPDIYSTVLWTGIISAVAGPFLFIPAAWVMRTNAFRYRKR